ncbi:MAG: hypothetical protein F6J93_22920 [Oscillatoria sp. SIO1A7]|nr:hypothetical protein [Oscillatoria sp. SIO1A7]
MPNATHPPTPSQEGEVAQCPMPNAQCPIKIMRCYVLLAQFSHCLRFIGLFRYHCQCR